MPEIMAEVRADNIRTIRHFLRLTPSELTPARYAVRKEAENAVGQPRLTAYSTSVLLPINEWLRIFCIRRQGLIAASRFGAGGGHTIDDDGCAPGNGFLLGLENSGATADIVFDMPAFLILPQGGVGGVR